MGIEELIAMLENRLALNAQQRAAAFARGDVNHVASIDADDATTRTSLEVLRSAIN